MTKPPRTIYGRTEDRTGNLPNTNRDSTSDWPSGPGNANLLRIWVWDTINGILCSESTNLLELGSISKTHSDLENKATVTKIESGLCPILIIHMYYHIHVIHHSIWHIWWRRTSNSLKNFPTLRVTQMFKDLLILGKIGQVINTGKIQNSYSPCSMRH